jgi:nucleotide-binding universal stress UspA family protein
MTTAHSRGNARIVVGIDGSASSERALHWAVEEARIRGADLEIIHAWHGGLPGLIPDQPDEVFQRHSRSVLDTAVSGLPEGAASLVIDTRPVKGHPAAVLVDASADAELVVVGSHGHGGVAGSVLGSVSQRVASHARCPVVIVRWE